jgi:hypothetical protein
LSKAEYEHFTTTLEGAIEEFEELENQHEWFSTNVVQRLEDCLELLRSNVEH